MAREHLHARPPRSAVAAADLPLPFDLAAAALTDLAAAGEVRCVDEDVWERDGDSGGAGAAATLAPGADATITIVDAAAAVST